MEALVCAFSELRIREDAVSLTLGCPGSADTPPNIYEGGLGARRQQCPSPPGSKPKNFRLRHLRSLALYLPSSMQPAGQCESHWLGRLMAGGCLPRPKGGAWALDLSGPLSSTNHPLDSPGPQPPRENLGSTGEDVHDRARNRTLGNQEACPSPAKLEAIPGNRVLKVGLKGGWVPSHHKPAPVAQPGKLAAFGVESHKTRISKDSLKSMQLKYCFQLQHRPNQGCPLPAPATRGLRLQAQEVLGSLRGVNMSHVQEDPARGPGEAIGWSQASELVPPALGAGGGNGLRLQVPGRTASLQLLQVPPGKQPSRMPRQLRKFPRRGVRLGSQGSERRGKRFPSEGQRKEKQGQWSKQPGHALHTLLPWRWCRRQIIPVKQAWEPTGPTSE